MNRLPLEILRWIAEFAVEPVYKLAHGLSGYEDGDTLGHDGLLYLCENPHPGICVILEANLSKLTSDMWAKLADHPAGAAFEFLTKHPEKVPDADWELMQRRQKEYDMDAHMDWYSNESLTVYGLPDELTGPEDRGNLYVGRDWIESRNIFYHIMSHSRIIELIELEIVDVEEFEEHALSIQYIYSHPDAIQYNVEASSERYDRMVYLLGKI